MNKVNLIGRLTADTELRKNSNDIPYIRFTLAVNRNFTKEDGTREADFISCVAWKKTAELINQYFKKGSEIGITGRIQTGSYDKQDGSKGYSTDVIVEEITFLGSKKDSRPEPEYTGELPQEPAADDFNDASELIVVDDDDLPF